MSRLTSVEWSGAARLIEEMGCSRCSPGIVAAVGSPPSTAASTREASDGLRCVPAHLHDQVQ